MDTINKTSAAIITYFFIPVGGNNLNRIKFVENSKRRALTSTKALVFSMLLNTQVLLSVFNLKNTEVVSVSKKILNYQYSVSVFCRENNCVKIHHHNNHKWPIKAAK